MAIKILTADRENMTLDRLLWEEFRQEIALRVETTLSANNGLAAKGIFLPVGTKVEVEIEAVTQTVPVVRVRRLWG